MPLLLDVNKAWLLFSHKCYSGTKWLVLVTITVISYNNGQVNVQCMCRPIAPELRRSCPTLKASRRFSAASRVGQTAVLSAPLSAFSYEITT